MVEGDLLVTPGFSFVRADALWLLRSLLHRHGCFFLETFGEPVVRWFWSQTDLCKFHFHLLTVGLGQLS